MTTEETNEEGSDDLTIVQIEQNICTRKVNWIPVDEKQQMVEAV